MDFFHYQSGKFHCEEVDLQTIANQFQTPAYVYSQAALTANCQAMKDAFSDYPTSICYAAKANSNINLLKEIVKMGLGVDVVSVGEIERALLAGCKPEKIVYSGVGKRDFEIKRALEVGIHSFNVESVFELEDIARVAKICGKTAQLCLRLNPNVDAKTNPKISTGLYTTKFGLSENKLPEALAVIKKYPQLKLIGLTCHIGSQIVELAPLKMAAERLVAIAKDVQARGFALECLDLGGGLGIRYRNETPPTAGEYAQTLIEAVRPSGLKLIVEPGRVLVGNIGVLLTSVIGTKEQTDKRFVIVDAAMNDLIRPTLYDAHHDIHPYKEVKEGFENVEVVGPICETGDFLAENCPLPRLQKADLLVIRGAGAYAASMASNYNSRVKSIEVMVTGSKVRVMSRRQELPEIWAQEVDL